MSRYDDDDSSDFERDIEVASLGPISIDYRPSKYADRRENSRSPSRRQNRAETFHQGDDNYQTNRWESQGSRKSKSFEDIERIPSEHTLGMTSVYSSRSVSEDQADVVGQSLTDDMKEFATWRTSFSLAQTLAGVPVMVAQIPEVISYAYIAGIDPFIALQSTWIMNIVTSIVGGRPGLLSSASGFSAIAIRRLVQSHGEGYIYYAVIFSGTLQIAFASLQVGKYIRLLPPAITIGLLNASCLLLYVLQLRFVKELPTEDAPTDEEDRMNMPWAYYYGYDLNWIDSPTRVIVVLAEGLITLLICFFLPRYFTLFPSTLVAMAVVTAANVGVGVATNWDAPTIDDYCKTKLPTSRYYSVIFISGRFDLPGLFKWETVSAIIPTGMQLFCVNLIETMVAINVVDKFTNSDSEQDRVFLGQGVANCISGVMGGMGGTGSAFQSLHSLKSDGVSSISTLLAGVYLLLVLMVAYPVIAMVPLGAAVGITMYMLCNMLQWTPLLSLIIRLLPKSVSATRPAHLRLSTPDLFATIASSCFVLFSSINGFVGFLTGMIAYACDPISHAIIYGSNESSLTLTELKISSKHFFSKETTTEEAVDNEPNELSIRGATST